MRIRRPTFKSTKQIEVRSSQWYWSHELLHNFMKKCIILGNSKIISWINIFLKVAAALKMSTFLFRMCKKRRNYYNCGSGKGSSGPLVFFLLNVRLNKLLTRFVFDFLPVSDYFFWNKSDKQSSLINYIQISKRKLHR